MQGDLAFLVCSFSQSQLDSIINGQRSKQDIERNCQTFQALVCVPSILQYIHCSIYVS